MVQLSQHLQRFPVKNLYTKSSAHRGMALLQRKLPFTSTWYSKTTCAPSTHLCFGAGADGSTRHLPL